MLTVRPVCAPLRKCRVHPAVTLGANFGHRTGGAPSLGYQARDRKLVIVDGEAEIVRSIFRRYAELGSVRLLEDEPVEGRAC
jgi:site-specific DNA recombinase